MLPVRLHTPMTETPPIALTTPLVGQGGGSISRGPTAAAVEAELRPGGRVGFGGCSVTTGGSPGSFNRNESPLLSGPSRLAGSASGLASRSLGSGAGVGGSQPTTPLVNSNGVGMIGGVVGSVGAGSMGPGKEGSLGVVMEEGSSSAVVTSPRGGGAGAGGGGGGGSRLGTASSSTPCTLPSLRIVDVRSYMPRNDRDESSGEWVRQ